ncbi:hypothetical protein GEMRC1_002439 [Eukaryota sp. GEM-RC1]
MSVTYNKKLRSNAFRRKNMNKHQDVYNVFSYTSTGVDGKSVQLGPNGDYILFSRSHDNATNGLSISTNNDEFLSDLVQSKEDFFENIVHFINSRTQYLASKGAKVPDISSRFKKVYGMNAEENEDLSEFYSIDRNVFHEKLTLLRKEAVKWTRTLKKLMLLAKKPQLQNLSQSPLVTLPSNPLLLLLLKTMKFNPPWNHSFPRLWVSSLESKSLLQKGY